MLTLSYGYLKPQTGDKGSLFFPALEGDIQQLNDHNHNGVNSAQLTSASSVAVTGPVPSGSWAAQGGGTYRQTVTMPIAGMFYDDYAVTFRDSTTGRTYLLSHVRVTTTTYYVYVNNNSLDLVAVYT